MLIKRDDIDRLYGFGAVSHEANTAQLRRNKHMLSLFAAALSTAVIIVMIALLPITATSSFFNNPGTSAHTLGVAVTAVFLLSITVSAIMLAALGPSSRKCYTRRYG